MRCGWSSTQPRFGIFVVRAKNFMIVVRIKKTQAWRVCQTHDKDFQTKHNHVSRNWTFRLRNGPTRDKVCAETEFNCHT